MSLKEELELKDNLEHPSAYLDIDEYGEDALLDGRFTLAEVQQIATLMKHRQEQYKQLIKDLP